jgi:hypothetical protein
LIALAIFAYTNLEIYPQTVPKAPPRHIRANDFFALETWLSKTGHPVRTIQWGDAARILRAPEKTVYVEASSFDPEGAAEPLKPWMEAGGWLIFSTGNVFLTEGMSLLEFLESFGIACKTPDDSSLEKGGDDAAEPLSGEKGPDFHPLVWFELMDAAGEPDLTITENWQGEQRIMLVRIPQGAGGLAVFGPARFMENEYLKRETNARLAWDLTGARAGGEEPGLLFIRGQAPVKSLFGRLAERGNLLPLGLSLLILIGVGFWMVVPGFGLVFQEKNSPGRPIGERFRTELRFLKKYQALEIYLELYIHEIKRKLRGREAAPELAAIEQALAKKGRLSCRQIVRSLQILETILESL